MYPTHDELIEFIHLLGYPNHKDGICFGLGAMAISPPLTGSTEKANQRLQKIKSSLDAYKEIQRTCEEEGALCRTLNWYLDVTYETEDKIDILAYCAGVAFHLDPANYKYYFDPEEFIYQNFLLTNSLIQSIETEEKSGLALAGTIVNYYMADQKDSAIKEHILVLENSLNSMDPISSFSCLIFSHTHAIHLSYCAKTQDWCYFGINTKTLGYFFTDDIDEIADLIKMEFFREIKSGVVLTVQFYCLNIDKEAIASLIKCYQNRLIINGLLDVSESKLQQDDVGSTWLCQLAKYNDITGMAHLIANNVDLNVKDRREVIALNYAVYCNSTGIVELILFKLRSHDKILDKLILNFFLNQQKNDNSYLLSTDTEILFNDIINTHKISDDNKVFFLKLYIIVRENEYRKNRNQYNSFFAQFFNPSGSNSRAKLNAANALLAQEEDVEKRSALQSGRLRKIAAFFLNPSHNSPQNQLTHIKPAILTA